MSNTMCRRAQRLSQSRNPHRLYRHNGCRVIFGVCAGIADYLGIGTGLVRLLAITSMIFFFPVTVMAYLALAIFLPPRPQSLFRDADEEVFWRSVTDAPDKTFGAVRQKFRDLDSRLQRMEQRITAEEFDLRRQFKDLEG